MPPRSYVITAIVLAVILFGSRLYPFYWLFATTAGVLTIVGVIRIGRGLRGPPWVGIGLAIPAIFWTAHTLYDVYSRPVLPEPVVPGLEGILANTIAGAAALYLLEMITGRRTVFWLGYAILAGAALCSSVSLIGLFPSHGINFWFAFDSVHYTFISRPVTLLGSVLPYLAYISLAIVVGLQRRFEIWVSVVIAAVGLFLIYKVGDLVLWIPMEGQHDGLIGWPEPVIMFVGAVAVSRLGTLLSAQPATDAAIGSGSAIAPPASPITAEPNNGPQQPSSPIPQNANVTREPVLSNKNGDWGPIISRGLLIYFSVLAGLTLAAMVDASTLFGVVLHIFLGSIFLCRRPSSITQPRCCLLISSIACFREGCSQALPRRSASFWQARCRIISANICWTGWSRPITPTQRRYLHRVHSFCRFPTITLTGATTADGMSMTATIPRRRAKIFVSNFSSKATPTTSW